MQSRRKQSKQTSTKPSALLQFSFFMGFLCKKQKVNKLWIQKKCLNYKYSCVELKTFDEYVIHSIEMENFISITIFGSWIDCWDTLPYFQCEYVSIEYRVLRERESREKTIARNVFLPCCLVKCKSKCILKSVVLWIFTFNYNSFYTIFRKSARAVFFFIVFGKRTDGWLNFEHSLRWGMKKNAAA